MSPARKREAPAPPATSPPERTPRGGARRPPSPPARQERAGAESPPPWRRSALRAAADPPEPRDQSLSHAGPAVAPICEQVRRSVGVILCRLGPQTRRWEVMLVRRRYTYAFADFVHGRYPTHAPQRAVAQLLRGMTVEELLDVISLNFAQMWYRVWLGFDRDEHFRKKRSRFHSAFLRNDGGRALRAAAYQAPGRGALLWEPPKGRRSPPSEADVSCAIRELEEETGIAKPEYRFLPGARRRVSFVQSRVRYRQLYYIALAGPRLHRERDSASARARPSFPEICKTGEVSEARWFDIEQVRLLDSPSRRLETLVAPALRMAKKFSRGQSSAAFARPAPAPAAAPKTWGAAEPPPPAGESPAGSPRFRPGALAGGSPAGSPRLRPGALAGESPPAAEDGWSQVLPRRRRSRDKPSGKADESAARERRAPPFPEKAQSRQAPLTRLGLLGRTRSGSEELGLLRRQAGDWRALRAATPPAGPPRRLSPPRGAHPESSRAMTPPAAPRERRLAVFRRLAAVHPL